MITGIIKSVFFRPAGCHIIAQYQKTGLNPRIKFLNYKESSFRYLVLNDEENLPTLFFIHGAPGHILDLESYFKTEGIYQKSRIIAVERPGYGWSSFGKPMASIQEYAEAISQVLKKEYKGATCIIAHSYGGPIACKMAIDNPQLVNKLILLAPALDPDNERIYKIAYLTKVPVLKKLIPMHLRMAAVEKFAHQEDLRLLKPLWEKLITPVVHFHGTRDRIVPYENLNFAKKHFSNSANRFITLPGVDHLINYSPKKEIVAAIQEWINNQH